MTARPKIIPIIKYTDSLLIDNYWSPISCMLRLLRGEHIAVWALDSWLGFRSVASSTLVRGGDRRGGGHKKNNC